MKPLHIEPYANPVATIEPAILIGGTALVDSDAREIRDALRAITTAPYISTEGNHIWVCGLSVPRDRMRDLAEWIDEAIDELAAES